MFPSIQTLFFGGINSSYHFSIHSLRQREEENPLTSPDALSFEDSKSLSTNHSSRWRSLLWRLIGCFYLLIDNVSHFSDEWFINGRAAHCEIRCYFFGTQHGGGDMGPQNLTPEILSFVALLGNSTSWFPALGFMRHRSSSLWQHLPWFPVPRRLPLP